MQQWVKSCVIPLPICNFQKDTLIRSPSARKWRIFNSSSADRLLCCKNKYWEFEWLKGITNFSHQCGSIIGYAVLVTKKTILTKNCQSQSILSDYSVFHLQTVSYYCNFYVFFPTNFYNFIEVALDFLSRNLCEWLCYVHWEEKRS